MDYTASAEEKKSIGLGVDGVIHMRVTSLKMMDDGCWMGQRAQPSLPSAADMYLYVYFFLFKWTPENESVRPEMLRYSSMCLCLADVSMITPFCL